MKDYLTLTNENNETKEFEILFSFESEETNKRYVTYTDYSKDDEGNIICYSASIDDSGKLSKIDTEHEKAMVNELLNTLVESTKMNYLNKE